MENRRFTGKWITSGEFADLEPIPVFHRELDRAVIPKSKYENKHILFRKKFSLPCRDRPVKNALVHISADDYFKLYVNGVFAGQGPCPGYPFHYYYNTIDVASLLRPGENVLAVHTYYQGLINRIWVSGDNRHGLLLDLDVEGETAVHSDDTFLCREHSGFTALAKTGYDTQFMERYDSSAPEAGFEKSDFDDGAWGRAVCRTHVDYEVFPQPTKQLVFEEVAPVSVVKTSTGFIADFGRVYVGYLRIKARGPKGGIITVLQGQELNDDGSVRFEMRANCRYREEWILSGAGDELDQFDYKCFRYAEFVLPGEGFAVDAESLHLAARHYPFTLKAKRVSGDPAVKKVWDLCVNSLRYGVQEEVHDCMDREKAQYLGDGLYSSLAHGIATGEYGLFEKLIADWLRSAVVTPGLMSCFPCSLMQEHADYALLAPLFCVMHYRLTGNRRFLGEVFGGMKAMLLWYRDAYSNARGLLSNLDKWCIVEWPANARDGYDADITQGKVCTALHNAVNALYIGACKNLNKIASIIGEEAVIDIAPVEKVFIETFYDPAAGLFKDSDVSSHISLPGNAYPLLFGICPGKEAERRAVSFISEKGLGNISFYISFAALAGLVRVGRRDLCTGLIASDESWLRMIRNGATTTWEAWDLDGKWNTSLFHLAFTLAFIFLAGWDMEGVFDL